jgi:hypothetical protein
MERPDQKSKRGSLLFLVALLAVVAAVWGAVALASGSGSGSVPSAGTPAPAVSTADAAWPVAAQRGPDRDCPEDGGGGSPAPTTPSTPSVPSTPSTPSTPSAPTTTDGSTNPSL